MEGNHLLEHLYACATACNKCYNACLNEEDINMMTRCIELDRECAEICLLTASAVARDSENREKYLAICAEFCQLCADECAKHGADHCKECADMCRKCAEVCSESPTLGIP